MADFNSTNQTSEPIVKSTIQGILQTVFGRSDRQIEVVKGAEPPQEKFAVGEALESRLSQVFQGYQDLAKDRLSKYRDYDKMDTASTECQTALDIYAEEASQKDAKTGLKVWIESEDENLAADLNQMLQRIKMEFKAYGIYRNLAKYGDCFLYLMSGAYGIHDIQFVHPSRIERVQEDGLLGFKSPDLASILLPESKTQMFKPWEFLHQRIYAFDQETVYGRSFLESVRKVYKELSMLETMIILYRISKAIQRNIFYVDVGQSSLPEVQNLVKDYTKFLKNKNQFIDPKTKDFKLEFDPATILQDIVWPVRPGSESRVEKLENQMTLDGLKDLEHFRERLRTGLNIPLDFLTGEQSGGWNSKESLMLQDARFSRKITKLQDAMREGIVRLCQIHVAIKDRKYISPQEFKVQLGTLSDTAERQREDIMLRKAQVIEILSNVSVTLSLNRWQWADYLFDQILPLPATLRAKLYTPDPALEIEFEKTQKMAAKGANTGALNKGIKPNKPPKKTTADNLNKGFRSYGYGGAPKRVEDELITGKELLEEFKEALTEVLPTEEMKSKKSKKFLEKLITMESNVFGLDEKEVGHYIEVIKELAPETIQNFKKINSTEKWEKFNNITEGDYSTVKVDNDPLNALVKSIIL